MKRDIHISESLRDLLNQLNPKQQELIAEMLRFYMDEYKKIRRENPNAIPSVAHSFQAYVQELVDKQVLESERKVSCGKGCSFCCYLNVDITIDEAALLLEYCSEEGIEIDSELLNLQNGLRGDSFMKLPLKSRKCVFLDDKGCCKVYEFRPSSCRKLIAVSEPSQCDTHKNLGAEVEKLVQAEVEVVTAAPMNVVESGSMADMLLKAVKQ